MPDFLEISVAFILHMLESVLSLVFWSSLTIFDVAGDHGRFREISGDSHLESEIRSPFRCTVLAFAVSSPNSIFQRVSKGLPQASLRDPRNSYS